MPVLQNSEPSGSGAETMASAARFRRLFLLATLAAAACGSVVFLSAPEIDLWAARHFYTPGHGFVWNRPGISEWTRNGFRLVYIAGFALAVAGMLASAYAWRRPFGLDFARSLFLLLCLAIGPGLIANLVLKEHWGRARPVQVSDLGGQKRFTPPLIPANECPRNCAFVSGEASNMYALFFAGIFLFPHARTAFIAAGIVGGLAAGVMRMAQGGHFLSDVFFAGIFMALSTVFLHWLMFQRRPDLFGEKGPLRAALARVLGRA